MDLSTQDNLICVHPYQNGPQCWSSAPCQYKPLPEVFPDHVAYMLAPTNFSGWILFPEGIFLFCSAIPLFELHAYLLLNSQTPLAFAHDHERHFAVKPTLVTAEVVCCGSITNMELFLIMGVKNTVCYFCLYKPIWPSSTHQIFFFFWLRQPDSDKVLLAYVFHYDAEYLNSKWSEKGNSISCPFCIPTAMSLGWSLCMQKATESQRESVLERVSAMECSKPQQHLSVRFKGICHSLGIVKLGKYFRGISFCLHGYTIISVQLGVCIYMKKIKFQKKNNSSFWLSWWKSQTGWKNMWFLQCFTVITVSCWARCGNTWRWCSNMWLCITKAYWSTGGFTWGLVQKFTPRFQTRTLELYGKPNKAITQCFLMVLILKALLEKQKSECSWDAKSYTEYKHKVYK